MNFKTAPRTKELMTGAVTLKATSGACLAGASRVNQSNLTFAFNFILSKGKEHSPWPGVEPPVPKSRTFLPLPEVQVFKDQNTVLGSPFHQSLGGYMTEVLGAASLLTLKPFEGPSDGSGALTLCLTGRKLFLEPLDGLTGSFVGNPPFKAGNKKFSPLRVNRHKNVGLIKVNPNGEDTRCIWNFNIQGNVTDKLSVPDLYCDTVYFLSFGQHRLEVIRDGIVKTLSASYRPDRKGAVLSEVGVPSTFADKEKSKRLLILDRLFEFVAIVLGRYISSCNEPEGGAGKLTGKLSFNRMIDGLMQRECSKRLPFVPGFGRNLIADLYKGLEGCLEVFVGFYDYLSCALGPHSSCNIPLTRGNAKTKVERR